MIGKALSR